MAGYIYLLCEWGVDLRYKIGRSKNDPYKRLKNLSTGNSFEITVVNYYHCENYCKVEKWLHNQYRNKRTEGGSEWFTLSEFDVLGFINKCKEADETINLLLSENPFYR
jgi:hypothetical protein